MSINLEGVLGNERLLRAVTTLDRAEFERLLSAFEQRWVARRRRRTAKGGERERAAGAGNKGALPSAAHKLLFILFSLQVLPLAGGAGAALWLRAAAGLLLGGAAHAPAPLGLGP